ncbi:unnamed protein product, partial [Heterosigma akashiwo]
GQGPRPAADARGGRAGRGAPVGGRAAVRVPVQRDHPGLQEAQAEEVLRGHAATVHSLALRADLLHDPDSRIDR